MLSPTHPVAAGPGAHPWALPAPLRRCGALLAVSAATALALAGCSSSPSPADSTASASAPVASSPAVSSPVATIAPAPTVAPGTYSVTVTLTGGSGRATIQSPTTLTVTADTMTAEIVWSSPYYTWMEVAGIRYTPTSAQGENATFEIPVQLDVDIDITAETTAMSEPYDIDYTLHFDSASLEATP